MKFRNRVSALALFCTLQAWAEDRSPPSDAFPGIDSCSYQFVSVQGLHAAYLAALTQVQEASKWIKENEASDLVTFAQKHSELEAQTRSALSFATVIFHTEKLGRKLTAGENYNSRIDTILEGRLSYETYVNIIHRFVEKIQKELGGENENTRLIFTALLKSFDVKKVRELNESLIEANRIAEEARSQEAAIRAGQIRAEAGNSLLQSNAFLSEISKLGQLTEEEAYRLASLQFPQSAKDLGYRAATMNAPYVEKQAAVDLAVRTFLKMLKQERKADAGQLVQIFEDWAAKKDTRERRLGAVAALSYLATLGRTESWLMNRGWNEGRIFSEALYLYLQKHPLLGPTPEIDMVRMLVVETIADWRKLPRNHQPFEIDSIERIIAVN
ncbi:MAG: hypothetical protein JNL01_01280 [Bdellovibrionales bacterium]|nr:hypothetical protein [Bdellovibrionales bacterium]